MNVIQEAQFAPYAAAVTARAGRSACGITSTNAWAQSHIRNCIGTCPNERLGTDSSAVLFEHVRTVVDGAHNTVLIPTVSSRCHVGPPLAGIRAQMMPAALQTLWWGYGQSDELLRICLKTRSRLMLQRPDQKELQSIKIRITMDQTSPQNAKASDFQCIHGKADAKPAQAIAIRPREKIAWNFEKNVAFKLEIASLESHCMVAKRHSSHISRTAVSRDTQGVSYPARICKEHQESICANEKSAWSCAGGRMDLQIGSWMDFSLVSSSESQGQVGNVETGADGLPERVFTFETTKTIWASYQGTAAGNMALNSQ